MSDIAVDVDHVWKRFHRGEYHDSLRDAIPALFKSAFGYGKKDEELGKGDFWALNDIHFQLKWGETFGIIGHNGAGKSTLLKVLSRILRPNMGTVRVNGTFGSLIEIGAGFHGDLTGRENIYLNATILGMTKAQIDKKFDEIVDFSGIEPFIDTPVKRYSSGMGARLGFAIAAHMDPDILIVDEILSVGDTAFQKKCLGRMQNVAGEGRTVLFVSHNMAAVRNLCKRAILLQHGKMLADGECNSVVNQYYEMLRDDQLELERACRAKNQKITITKVLCGRSLSTLAEEGFCDCYGDLYVRIFFTVQEPVKDCTFSIVFIDEIENHQLGLNTRLTEKQIGTLSQDGFLDFHVPHFSLAPGRYIYGAAFCNRTHSDLERLDHFVGNGCLYVENSNFPGWNMSDGYNQRVFAPFEWELHTNGTIR